MPTTHPKLTKEDLEILQSKLELFDFTPEQILALLLIIGNVHDFITTARDEHTLQKRKSLLAQLLQYLIANKTLAVTHKSLIASIRLILGIAVKQEHEDVLEEEEQEAGLSMAERKRRYELAVYELYKIINPRRLAGETELDNFLMNVALRGIEVARYYLSGQNQPRFEARDLIKLAPQHASIAALINGDKGTGLGRGL